MYSDAEVFTFDPEGKSFLLLEIRQCPNDGLDNNVEARIEYNAVPDNALIDRTYGLPHEDDSRNDSRIGNVPQDAAPQNNAPQNNIDSVTRDAQVREPPPLETMGVQKKRTVRRVKLRVSSRHLALASSIFSHMISSTQQEDQILPLEGDDIDALQILLNTAHGLHKKAPRTISRNMLYEVLKLVDKYEFDQP
ncbi:hypothetical protein LTR05_008558 [Lithohypha guttulata]|uniref:BTB domain-containing protein n=1 Tax=Lithohypha guttulata TaxID=1690604 RepID=A0AAN7QCD5_9EURO|nr:hypothetical protein LTR05_008558 [Lithohypha guttulata]